MTFSQVRVIRSKNNLNRGLDIVIKQLHNYRSFLAVTNNVLNTVATYQGRKVRVNKLLGFFRLKGAFSNVNALQKAPNQMPQLFS